MSRAFRNKEYLEWVRGRICVVSEKKADVSHHVRLDDQISGMGLKPSDYRVIPLTNDFHTLSEFSVHRLGERSFYTKYSLDIEKLIVDQMVFYLNEFHGESYSFLPGISINEKVRLLEDQIEKKRFCEDQQAEERNQRNKKLGELRKEQREKIKSERSLEHERELACAREYQKEQRQYRKPDKNSEYHKEMKQKASLWRQECYRKQRDYLKTLT